MQASLAPLHPVDDAVARLTRQYNAKGDLELYFVRQIAAAQITYESLQRNIDSLLAAVDYNDARMDRLSRAKAREQRQLTIALKELKDLQQRRNLLERFPDQTKDCPPLADHVLYIGEHPHIKPIPPLLRGRMLSPTDHTPRTVSQPDPEKRAKGIPDIKRLIPDPKFAA
ncbi:MAG: hypothetical protein ABI972_07895 [Acidobacteriota bacterium]